MSNAWSGDGSGYTRGSIRKVSARFESIVKKKKKTKRGGDLLWSVGKAARILPTRRFCHRSNVTRKHAKNDRNQMESKAMSKVIVASEENSDLKHAE